VSRHSDVYSGTAITVSAVSALVSRYSGDYSGLYSGATIVAATVVPRYAVVYYIDASHRSVVRKRVGGGERVLLLGT